MAQSSAEQRHLSPWSTRDKIKRLIWAMVQCTVFRCSPQPAYAWRAWLLRRFGASLGRHVKVRASARIEIPWNLTVGDHSALGDQAILYCLGPVTIGRYVTISQYAHLCAGTHDYRQEAMPLLRPPITIGDHVWVATDVFVGAGVTIGDRAIIGARASVFKDVQPGVVCGGNRARVLRVREDSPPPSE